MLTRENLPLDSPFVRDNLGTHEEWFSWTNEGFLENLICLPEQETWSF